MKFFVLLAIFLACGQANKIPSFPTGRIINGHDAVPHAAPYIVSISYDNKYNHGCGGTIIAKDWILTAAHCVHPGYKLMIVAGLHVQPNFDKNNSTIQIRKVDFIKNHENYTGGPVPNDISLLHLSEPLKYNQYVQPAILPAIGEIHSGSVHLYGWGMYEPYNRKGANVLQTIETKIVDLNKCKQTYYSMIDESNLCSDSLQKHIASCTGDSGGPLVIEREGVSSEVIGVVSWGFDPCGVQNEPSVYVRVSAFIDWIAKVQNAYYILH